MKNRLKNKLFLLALTGFSYQVLTKFGIVVDQELYKLGLDLLSYALIGAGIYTNFDNVE